MIDFLNDQSSSDGGGWEGEGEAGCKMFALTYFWRELENAFEEG